VNVSADVEATLLAILKSYDRIGFGRRGVLDAEQEILRLASTLPQGGQHGFRKVILSWIDAQNAERLAALLHYNLPEHEQTLAIRLCASVPIPESLPVLRRLQDEGDFGSLDADPRGKALQESIRRLTRH
jgi:hypothetical protein